MQPRGSGPPIFCIHGLGGEIYDFLEIARAMADDRKVYGLQASATTDTSFITSPSRKWLRLTRVRSACFNPKALIT